VGEDLIPILARFHREVVLPDIERIVGASEQRLRDEMQSLFGALAQRLDWHATDNHLLVADLTCMKADSISTVCDTTELGSARG